MLKKSMTGLLHFAKIFAKQYNFLKKDTHDLNDRLVRFEVVFNNCDDAVRNDSDKYLYSDSIHPYDKRYWYCDWTVRKQNWWICGFDFQTATMRHRPLASSTAEKNQRYTNYRPDDWLWNAPTHQRCKTFNSVTIHRNLQQRRWQLYTCRCHSRRNHPPGHQSRLHTLRWRYDHWSRRNSDDDGGDGEGGGMREELRIWSEEFEMKSLEIWVKEYLWIKINYASNI